MALVEIKVPDIGDFKDVAVIELLVKAGDTVKPEQSLITVESDKASMEIPSSQGGVIGTWLFAAVDACRTAQLMRAGLAPDAEEDAIARQLYGNPLAWGVTLVALGIAFLSHTLLGIQFPVRRTLPVALVILGLYMLFDYLKRRRRREELRGVEMNAPSTVVSSWRVDSARLGADFPTHASSRLRSAK